MAFSGETAELPFAIEGLTGNKNLATVRPTELLEALNVSFAGGTIQKEGGATKYNASAITGAPAVIAGFDWWPTLTTQRMVVVTDGGKILKDDGTGAFATELATGLAVSGVVPTFATGGKEVAANNRKLFIYTRKNQIQVLSADGATTAAVATPAADWSSPYPIGGFIHGNRHFAFGGKDPHRIYYTPATNHEDFTGAGSGSLSVFPGEGSEIIAGCSYKGLIILWKFPSGIYVINTADPTVANWTIERMTPGIGIASSRSFCLINNDILFMDGGGRIHALSAVNQFGDITSSDLTDKTKMIPFIRDNVNTGGLGDVRALFYQEKKEAHFAVPGLGASQNNRRIVIDFNGEIPKFRWSDRDVVRDLFTRIDDDNIERMMVGDASGFVRQMDQESRSVDGTAYAMEFQVPHTDLSFMDPTLATIKKNGAFLDLVVEPKGNWDLSVDILWDGTVKQTVQFNMGLNGASLGSFTLDTDVLAGDQVITKRRKIVGSGYRFSAIGRNAGADQDCSVAKMYLLFTRGA